MQIESLWHYPIKGLGGNSISHTTLSVNQTLPGDRRYALSANNFKAAQADDGVWLQKAYFLQLMQTEALAALSCQLDGDTITIKAGGKIKFEGDLAISDDLVGCQNFIANFLKLTDPKRLRIHKIDHGAFTDQSEPLISIGGTASLAAFAAATNTETDARRFRLNIIVATTAAFAENKWVGAKLCIGEAVVKIVDDVARCAAINVDPVHAKRQSDHLATMRQALGHSYLGVFGRVISPGAMKCGDDVTFIDDN